jgi:nucleoside-diphosphate-sugar epimerase
VAYREAVAIVNSSSSNVRTVLLGGGYTLQRLAQRLSSEMFVITSREKSRCDAWRSHGWNACQVSLDDRQSLDRLFDTYSNIETIVDSVPPLHGVDDPSRGVRNVVASLSGHTVRRILYLSTTGVFGRRDGSIVDEESAPAPWNAQGEARWRSECAYRESACAVTAFRLPAIYGPDRGVAVSLRNGAYRMIGSGEIWTNRIHVEDLVTAIELALGTAHLPEVLCISDDRPAQAKEVVEYVCTREGLPWPTSISEEEALRMGAYTMLSNQRVRNDRMKAVLGISLRYPSYKEGFAVT